MIFSHNVLVSGLMEDDESESLNTIYNFFSRFSFCLYFLYNFIIKHDLKCFFHNRMCITSIHETVNRSVHFIHSIYTITPYNHIQWICGLHITFTQRQIKFAFNMQCAAYTWSCLAVIFFNDKHLLINVCVRFSPKAKQKFEDEERRRAERKARGEDTWMLPEVDNRLQEIGQVRGQTVICAFKC